MSYVARDKSKLKTNNNNNNIQHIHQKIML